MLPANPPLPTPSYFPFHPEAGIQTSSLMSDSFAGLISATTRQNAGSSLNAAGCGPAGASNAPAATTCAELMVVSGSLRPVRRSHEAGTGDGATIRIVA